jgi:UDP-N-acetylmuramoyl-L-alanyl-D-glutamate--2,6-diaminopimelate ligase
LSSQRILPGDLYAALPGARAHGVDFAAQAVAGGAVAVLTDPEGADRAERAGVLEGRPVLVVDRPREVLGRLAARVYGDPAGRLRLIGVTGTQGKTTTTRLAEGALLQAGITSAVIGTVGTRVAGTDLRTSLTTPEAPDLHGLFARMCEERVAACAMEVSSHALVLGRVDGVVFDVAVFTNLGRDHLDFHDTVEDYFAAKASLFTPDRSRLGLVNLDDEHGRRLVREAGVPVRTFSASGAEADWRAVDVEMGPTGSRFTVVAPDGTTIPAGVPLPGDFNVANALAAVAACAEAGFDAAAVAAGLAAGTGVPGRLERVDAGQDFAVVVDYAHKPDAVEAALRTLRPLTTGRLLVVLGAGGDRDPGKRPIMGEIAARLADVLVVTDDNPRTEDPAAIRAAVLSGAAGPAEVLEVGDRRAAIREALGRARPGDIVLVAGKGHETGQEVGGVVHPFDDREVVAACLREQPAS